MRKIVLLMFMAFTINVTAQKFELTPSGFVDADNLERDYLVVEADGSATELYDKVELFVMGHYKDPKEVMSSVKPKMITLTGRESNAIHRNSMHTFDLSYTITFKFKDGKVRIDAPSTTMTTFNSSGKQRLHIKWEKGSLTGSNLGIYGKKDKLKSKRAKADLEKFFNAIVSEMISSLNKKGEDW